MSTSLPPAADPRPAPSDPVPFARRCAAFLQVFNAGTVAVVFYLCLLLTFSRWLPVAGAEGWQVLYTQAIVNLRQTLISGLLALLTIALLRAAALRAPAAPLALALGVLAAAAAALIAAPLRLLVYGTPLSGIEWSWLASVVLLWTMLGGLGYALMAFAQDETAASTALAEQQRAAEALRARQTQAHLSALQAQIEPHFLFNTLANVKRLYETAPARGREMLASLIDYLQAALPSMRQTASTVARELELARAYLRLLQMRMGERLAFSIEAPPELLAAEMPPLVLGTLLENAIKHGVGALPEGGRIDIRVQREPPGADGRPRLRLELRDTGAGFSGSGGHGVGLANTRSRLAALYGEAARLTLDANAPRGVVATVLLPLRLSDGAAP